MEGSGAKEPEEDTPTTSSETLTLISATTTTTTKDLDLQTSSCEATTDSTEANLFESEPPVNRAEILRALEVVERDSVAISESFTSLFASLRVALSGVCFLSINAVFLFGSQENEGNSGKLGIERFFVRGKN